MSDDVNDTILELMSSIAGADLRGTAAATRLTDLEFDSLVMVELAVALKPRLGIDITHDDLAACDTLDDVFRTVADRIPARA